MDISSARVDAGGGGVRVDEIESSFRKFVHVDDTRESSPSDGDDNSDEEGSEELEPFRPEPVTKCMEKFPGNLLVEEDDEPETAMQQLSSEGPIQPAVLLVSAMKGSREKLGASLRKLTVSWAPDVYDPIPNSLSHTVKSKQKKSKKDRDRDKESNNYKKNGKRGQKGNSRGGGGKDKKQLRKAGGRSDRGYKTLSISESPDNLDEFNVGSPDYCGSSFLKKSPANFHYSVAEAL
ncbi:uncharacterized protein LOC8269376 [Ricinus communis]|uniref:BRI1-KD interacting protein n=1 Tax=Ricinus communis TaxID=3988 RepID=B9SZB5_RICCO|nr:uncharacterized protein LOC8269376 [Ricinus communis]XP_015582189.1 uncharacterized protein LOC8269376 [Ricinus communis]EEF31041.1 conserved hypothetical protein [Ricinus communis]|eukprot:XP_002531334.1 uncharacterized protein LOC8269376 [Ricinus communis]